LKEVGFECAESGGKRVVDESVPDLDLYTRQELGFMDVADFDFLVQCFLQVRGELSVFWGGKGFCASDLHDDWATLLSNEPFQFCGDARDETQLPLPGERAYQSVSNRCTIFHWRGLRCAQVGFGVLADRGFTHCPLV
jgi:hypothetical protein